MTRQMMYGGFGIIALGLLSLAGVRSPALGAAGSNKSDVIARLENRIAALEARIAALEGQRPLAGGPSVFLGPDRSIVVPPSVSPAPPESFKGTWCYTIQIDGKTAAAPVEGATSQR